MADQDDKKTAPAAPSEELTPAPSSEQKPEEAPLELSADSQNILREFDQAGLEVAAMPESNELQERRKKTKNRLRELAEVGEPEDEENGEEAFEKEEGGLMDLLKEANLSKRQVGFCCGGVLVLILVLGLTYSGWKAWGNWQASHPVEETPVEETPEEQTPGEETPVSSVPDASLSAGWMVGQTTEADGSTHLGEDLGEAASSQDELTQLIVDFSEMYQAMQVDVNQLLDQSTDRATALSEYEQNLNYLLYVGRQNQERLLSESEALEEQFAAIENQKETQEEIFFDRLRNLDAYASSAALNSFVADGQEALRLRAHYQARQKLLSYYQQVMVSLSARIEDIQLNEEALLKGIRVVDVEGSDIDLIIDEENL
jgi:hypothetical protein